MLLCRVPRIAIGNKKSPLSLNLALMGESPAPTLSLMLANLSKNSFEDETTEAGFLLCGSGWLAIAGDCDGAGSGWTARRSSRRSALRRRMPISQPKKHTARSVRRANAVILVVSRLVGVFLPQIRQPHVVGEMLAGILLGPSLFWLDCGR